jgi:hypothetical protein
MGGRPGSPGSLSGATLVAEATNVALQMSDERLSPPRFSIMQKSRRL